jgi:hypothetical protein
MRDAGASGQVKAFQIRAVEMSDAIKLENQTVFISTRVAVASD